MTSASVELFAASAAGVPDQGAMGQGGRGDALALPRLAAATPLHAAAGAGFCRNLSAAEGLGAHPAGDAPWPIRSRSSSAAFARTASIARWPDRSAPSPATISTAR